MQMSDVFRNPILISIHSINNFFFVQTVKVHFIPTVRQLGTIIIIFEVSLLFELNNHFQRMKYVLDNNT